MYHLTNISVGRVSRGMASDVLLQYLPLIIVPNKRMHLWWGLLLYSVPRALYSEYSIITCQVELSLAALSCRVLDVHVT